MIATNVTATNSNQGSYANRTSRDSSSYRRTTPHQLLLYHTAWLCNPPDEFPSGVSSTMGRAEYAQRRVFGNTSMRYFQSHHFRCVPPLRHASGENWPRTSSRVVCSWVLYGMYWYTQLWANLKIAIIRPTLQGCVIHTGI